MSLQKLYGRSPEAMGTVSELFHSLLAHYPGDAVIKAFETWLERSQEFPTPADIVGLIRRGGKPPLSEATYIQISRKPGEDRTSEDWQYLREWEQEQRQGWDSGIPAETSSIRDENVRLRQRVKQLEAEVGRLRLLAGEKLEERRSMRFGPGVADRIAKTVEWMRSTGAPQTDIDAFILSQEPATQAG